MLIEEALADRRRRLLGESSDAEAGDGEVMRRRRAACLVERMLSSRSPAQADCSRLLEMLAGRLQLASPVIDQMMTSIEPLVMPVRRSRALAVMVADVIAFVEASAAGDGCLKVYVALGIDGDRLVLAVGAEGGLAPVGTADATRCLLRAGTIARLMGGRLDRGIDGDRMVVGITLPT